MLFSFSWNTHFEKKIKLNYFLAILRHELKVLARGVSSVLWNPIFGRNTRKIHLISYNILWENMHAFWMASFQCLAKSLHEIQLALGDRHLISCQQ